MKQKLGLRLAAGALFGALLLAVFFRGVEWRSLAAAFRSAHAGYLLAVVLLTVATYLGRAWRWGYLLAPLARVPLGELFASTVVGFMTGLVIPRAGEVVRPYLIAHRRDIPTSAAFASIILERLVDLLTVLMLLGLYLFVLPAPAAQRRGSLIDVLKAGAGLVALASCGVAILLWGFHRHAERVSAIVDRLLAPLPDRLAAVVGRALRAFGSGLAVFGSSPGHLLAIFGQSVIVWLTIALGIHCNNRAFGLELPFHASFLIIAFLTVGVAVPTPGMVGGFHESYLLALTQVFGVERGRAAAVGIACHALTNLPVLLGGAFFLGRFGLTLGRVVRITSDVDPDSPAGAAAPAVTNAAELRDRGAA